MRLATDQEETTDQLHILKLLCNVVNEGERIDAMLRCLLILSPPFDVASVLWQIVINLWKARGGGPGTKG